MLSVSFISWSIFDKKEDGTMGLHRLRLYKNEARYCHLALRSHGVEYHINRDLTPFAALTNNQLKPSLVRIKTNTRLHRDVLAPHGERSCCSTPLFIKSELKRT